jgi:hypothetical protein
MRKTLLAAGAATLAAFGATPALADTVCEWIEFSQGIATAAAPPPTAPRTPDHDRAATQVALAMFEALNAIDRRYESYLNFPAGNPRASQDVAAATAAYEVLLAHYPSQKTALEENYTIALAAVPNAAARDSGKTIGKAAAKAALAAGGIDPSISQTPYRPRTQPGVWTATALPVFEPFAVAFKPWILPRADAVRPAPPPALTSERWARDYDEVRHLGARQSKARTPEQSLMARYRITPNMMPTMRLVADARGRSLVANARLFALSSMVADDTGMATADAKLFYNFWRPATAIRNGDKDGNAATAPDFGWEPLIATPNHPEYPCAHCSFSAAVAAVMKAEVGNAPPGGVRVASRSIPSSNVQVLPSFDEWVRQVSFSRTLGGVHYRFSNEAGEEMGRKVAAMALAKVMRPLPRARGSSGASAQ